MSTKEEKLKQLEKKFNMAEEAVNQMTEVIDALDIVDDDLSNLALTELKEPGSHLPDLKNFEEVFTLDLLKKDFMHMRASILALITRGQSILDDTGQLDIGDMKASQLEALANLQKSTGENIKLLMGIYKDIIAVEKDKYVILRGLDQETLGTQPQQGQINVGKGGNVTQNVIVAGGTHDILRAIENAEKERKMKEVKEIKNEQ